MQYLQGRVFGDVIEIAVVVQQRQMDPDGCVNEDHQTRASRHSVRLPFHFTVPFSSSNRR